MNLFLLTAGILSLLLGIAHSVLGEHLIFKHKRKKGHLVPTKTNNDLKERHLRILWATWHLVSIFGWAFGITLIKISLYKSHQNTELSNFIIPSIMYAMLFSSMLVLIGTKGKHPGWVVLLIISILIKIAF